jgi:hypothetical protein
MSDIKKLVNWYNLLHVAELLIPIEKEEEGETDSKEVETPKKEKKSKTDGPKIAAATKTANPKNSTAGSKAPTKKPTVQRKSS